ncbi:MAG: hypothetical protein R6X34_18785 [Chloroflexota bacterium]
MARWQGGKVAEWQSGKVAEWQGFITSTPHHLHTLQPCNFATFTKVDTLPVNV